MKLFIFGVIVNILLLNICVGQNSESSDFLELGIKSGNFIESSFLENSRFQSELSDPLIESVGLVASPTSSIFSAKFRFGKKVSTKFHFISELGFSKYDEQVVCFCHYCDKVLLSTTLVSLNSVNAGIGARYEVLALKNFNISLESIASYSLVINESGTEYFGYSIHPIFGYQLSKIVNFNLKMGYEESFGDYTKKEKYLELGINYQLNKNSP